MVISFDVEMGPDIEQRPDPGVEVPTEGRVVMDE